VLEDSFAPVSVSGCSLHTHARCATSGEVKKYQQYSRMGTKSLCSSVDEERVDTPNQDVGYNFDSGLLLTRKSYVA
jgi:hypothetical protein